MVSVVPLRDTRRHRRSTECWCEPSVEWLNDETGLPYANGPLVIHNSADGREVLEQQGKPTGKRWATYHG
jgi:hypothetical protein